MSVTPERRYLVTGAMGCIGAWTVAAAMARGCFVVAYDIATDDSRLRIALDHRQLDELTRVRGDVTDRQRLGEVMDEYAITNVIHLAAMQVPSCRDDPPRGAQVDVVGTVNVLDAVRARSDRVNHLVYASSVAVYDNPSTGSTNAGVPATLYGVFKRADEGSALLFHADFGVSSIGLRPHTVYGPARDEGLTAAATLAMAAASRTEPYHIPFGGSAQFQYAPDVGEAFLRASDLNYRGASVHNLDGPVASIPELISAIEAVVPESAGCLTAAHEPLPFPPSVDSSSFVQLLRGHAARPLREGVAETISYFRDPTRPASAASAPLGNGLVRPSSH